MYLDKILGSKIKINILATLVNAENKEFMGSELAKEIGCSLSEVTRQISDLVNCGLVEMKNVGKAKVYSINKKTFSFQVFENSL